MARSNFEIANELNTLPLEMRLDLYTKLGLYAQESNRDGFSLGGSKNKETYRVILNKDVLTFVYTKLVAKEPYALGICKKYPEMANMIKNMCNISPEERKGLGIISEIDKIKLDKALKMFDVDNTNSESNRVDEKSDDFDDASINGEDLKDTADKKEDNKVDVDGISEEVMAEIDNLVNSLISLFDVFYAPLVQKKVDGILTDIGCYDFAKDKIITQTSIACKTLFNGIKDATQGKLKSAKIGESINWQLLSDGVTYFPQIVADILSMRYRSSGKEIHDKSWVSYRPHLRELISFQIKAVINGLGLNTLDSENKVNKFFELKTTLRRIYSTAFVVEKFNAGSEFEMRIISEDVQNTIGYNELGEMIAHGNLSKVFSQEASSIKVLANKNMDKNIHKYLFVLDESIYTKELLFAYKGMEEILKGGGKLGYNNTLIGKTLDGEQFTINLAAKQNIVTLVAAGPRSGKGVLTMNMCGTLIASGIPIVYLDYKPDMACVFWDLERKKGCKLLAIDSLSGKASSEPVRNYNFGLNAPSYITENSDYGDVAATFKLLPYYRGMQLMVALSYAINAKIIQCESERFIFILDEANNFIGELNTKLSAFDALIKELKPKKNEEPSEAFTYISKLKRFFSNLGTRTFFNTTAGKSGVGCIILGQQSEISNWSSSPNDDLKFLVSNCNQKLLGRGTVNSTVYSIGGAAGNVAGEKYANNETGYFAYVPVNKAGKGSEESIKVVKSYMTLNDNDACQDRNNVYNGSGYCVKTLLSNITDAVSKENAADQLYNNGVPEARVGFEGMMEFIAQESGINNIWEIAGMGYTICERLTNLLGITGPEGKYNSIEEWMFDCSLESLNDSSDIEMALSKGYKLFDSSYGDSLGEEKFVEADIPTELNIKANNIGNINDVVNTNNLNPNLVSEMKNANIDYTNVKLSGSDLARADEAKELLFNGLKSNIDLDDEVIEFGDEDKVDFGDVEDLSDKIQKVTEDEVEEQEYVSAEVDITPFMSEPAVEFNGATGRDVIIKPSKSKKMHRCTDENTIFVSMEDYAPMENRAFKLFKTVDGAEYEFTKRWDAILNGISKKMKPDLVTRVVIGDDCLYINKQLVHMTGILGGLEDVRMEDVVNFGKLFKKFPNIKEITMTGTIFEAAQIQLGNPFMMLFELGKNLNFIEVIGDANSEPVIIRRRDLDGASSAREQANALIKEARFKNQYEAASASMSNKLERQSPGYKTKVYKVADASSKLSGKSFSGASASWSNVKNNFKKNKKIKTVAWTGALAITGAVGIVFGAAGWIGKKIGSASAKK